MRSVVIALAILSLSPLSALGTPVTSTPNPVGGAAGTIAALVNQYLQASIGATTTDDWLEASGAALDRDQSLLIPEFSPALPSSGQVTIDEFNNSFTASISANDGVGDSISNEDVYLTQFGVTYSTSVYNAFCLDLFHTVTLGQTYALSVGNDLDTAFTNGARMAYIINNYGLQDLSANPDQAAAVQIALWDLSLNNHNPTMFEADGDGTYSSGDPNVFSVNFATPMPEPTTGSLLLAGMILLSGWRMVRAGLNR
jgi:hypothetical protein